MIRQHIWFGLEIELDKLFHKTISNIQEVIARGGKILMITDDSSLQSDSENIWKIFRLPDMDPILETLIYTIPIQMLAYYTAVELGNDVDQPRNLAKSVTVWSKKILNISLIFLSLCLIFFASTVRRINSRAPYPTQSCLSKRG